ncbi:MAG: imidazole glycerol phosphate synthase subunit HisF [Dysgonamonadaceae bacterium]|nr:imidazole glycerol phosphate synthase subunit HisF [Dysgonamonadaceae bacterium]
MTTKKIIACLDIKDGSVVKGINFVDINEVGNPVEFAKRYEQEGADELVLLDITATNENRGTVLELVAEVANEISIPFTVGGGIHSVDEAQAVIVAGADKVSVGSAAIKSPELITQLSNKLGKDRVVLAIDCKLDNNEWLVYTQGGKKATELRALDWAMEGERLGAGSILLTSMNNDGAKNGFATDITKAIADAVNIPVVASGGAGTQEHFLELFQQTSAESGLAASVFHYKEINIGKLKEYLRENEINI